MINKSELFTKEVVYAILNRKAEIERTYIILSRLMNMYDMDAYTSIADRLIMDSESIGYAIDNNHVVLDVFENDIWLDEAALHVFSAILEGFIEKDQYNRFRDYVESLESARRIHNQALALYQGKSLKGLFRTIREHSKYKSVFPDEFEMIRHWCRLELLSRTPFPRLYYFLKELPDKLRFLYLKNSLFKAFPNARAGKQVQP